MSKKPACIPNFSLYLQHVFNTMQVRCTEQNFSHVCTSGVSWKYIPTEHRDSSFSSLFVLWSLCKAPKEKNSLLQLQ